MKKPLNPLIEKKLTEIVHDTNTKTFILAILDIERGSHPRGKNAEYRNALAKFSKKGGMN